MSEQNLNSDSQINASHEFAGKTCPLIHCHSKKRKFQESSLREHYTSESHQRNITIFMKQNAAKTSVNSQNDNRDIKPENLFYITQCNEALQIAEKFEDNGFKLQLIDSMRRDVIGRNESNTQTLNEAENMIDEERTRSTLLSINTSALKLQLKNTKSKMMRYSKATKYGTRDGTLLWRIANVHEKVADAQSERQTSIYSPDFYTSPTGYRMCARLYLNGDGTSRGNYLSIFLVILRGPYDALLEWPFNARVSFCLYDQKAIMHPIKGEEAKHAIECFRPDINSISFQRPTTDMNIASGIPRFLSLEEFEQPVDRNRYIVNDTIYIKIFVDFQTTPRNLLPFIHNLNPGLPKHIQEKLIEDEKLKCETKTLS